LSAAASPAASPAGRFLAPWQTRRHPPAGSFFFRVKWVLVERKLVQLCGQVAEALGYALGSAEDPLLNDLLVASVEPDIGARRLRVTVFPPVWPGDAHAAAVRARLERATGFLRSEVAASIHRKRTPELVFRLVHPDEIDL
jgi:ribosome-binding factor A